MLSLMEEQRVRIEKNMGLVGRVIRDCVHAPDVGCIYTCDALFPIGYAGLCKAAQIYQSEYKSDSHNLNELRGGCLCWVLSPQKIYVHVWKEDPVDCDHIVCNTICRLRRKLARLERLQTVEGYGYEFVVKSGADQ